MMSHADSPHDPWLHLRGKSTFANDLATRVGGVRFSPDAWVVSIFGANTPDDGWSRESFDDRYRRIRGLVDSVWPAVVGAGVDVVLDYGFWTRDDRDRTRELAADSGAEVVTYDVRCRESLARARCAERNDDLAGSFFMDDAAYEALKERFETLDDDEPRVMETDS